MRSAPERILSFLSSLKLAVVVILGLAASCATATVIESLDDTATARYWVYRSAWFHALLGLFGVILLSVMIDRWPWKKKHLPFLLAHIGLLTLLFGSWLTERDGLDGTLRVTEGDSTPFVEMDATMVVVTEGEKVYTYPVQWLPPTVKFEPYSLHDEGLPYDLRLTDYMTHADASYDFVPKPPLPLAEKMEHPQPALKIQLTGGPMQIQQDFWLWTGDPSTQGFQAGPAWLELIDATDDDQRGRSPNERFDDEPHVAGPDHGPKLSFRTEKGAVLFYRAESSSGEVRQGRIPYRELAGREIDPNWKGVKIKLSELVPDAWVKTTYSKSRTQYGDLAPPSAIEVSTGQGAGRSSVWLGVGARAVMRASGHDLEVGYFHKRLMLPFSVRLDRFTVDHYQGTMNPASYSSRVTVIDNNSFQRVISMNEPLKHKGITLYQASYEDAMPRPVTSILAVNRDPGRPWKYLGSILIVLGSALLFASRYRRSKPGARKETA